MSDNPTASPVVLGRWEKPGNLASIAALAAAGQVTILPHELIRTTDGRVYHWTGTALEIVSAPVHHGTVADVAALDGIYLLPSCTRGVHPGDTAYVPAAGCEYRVTAGVNATATWAACASIPTIPTIPTTPAEVGADPAGTASAAVSAHNTATDSHADLRTLIGGKQAAGDYLLASDTAANSAKLGGVAASNFPQYEENSWTPEITASVTAPTGVTYALRYGRYTKMGKTVFCRFGMRLSNKGSGGSGRIRIGNLPYVIASGGTGSWMANSTFTISIVNGLQPMQLSAGNAYIDGFAITTTYDALTNTDYLIGEFFYHTT